MTNTNASHAPIVLFVYNRPEHTQRTLESLVAARGFRRSTLVVYCDGPKDDADAEAVEATRRVVESFGLPNAYMVERETNLGLAESVIRGITEVSDAFGRFIMLEDDYLLSPHFLDFMNRALNRYADDDRVMHVSGYTFPADRALPETFFLRPAFGLCWSFGGWKRAWDMFEPDPYTLLQELAEPKLRWEFSLGGNARFPQRIRAQAEGRIDSWSTRWYASIFLNGGLTLRPGRSLVTNTGNDGTGVHCVETDIFDVSVTETPVRRFPKEVVEDQQALEAAIAFHRRMQRDEGKLRKAYEQRHVA